MLARAEDGPGQIRAGELAMEGNAYVDLDVTLEVDVVGGVGEISLKVV